MTRHPDPLPGQMGFFGDPIPEREPAARPVSRLDSNDIDLMHTIAGNAMRCGYVLVGASDRVYAHSSEQRNNFDDQVVRVPRYEEDAVHQLLRRRWLTLGGSQGVACGGVSFSGTALLVPKHTRARVHRWNDLQRPQSWPSAHRAAGKPERPDPVCASCEGTGRIPDAGRLVWNPQKKEMERIRSSSPCHWCQRNNPDQPHHRTRRRRR